MLALIRRSSTRADTGVIIARTIASTVSGTAASRQENEENSSEKLVPPEAGELPAGLPGRAAGVDTCWLGSLPLAAIGPTEVVEVAIVVTQFYAFVLPGSRPPMIRKR